MRSRKIQGQFGTFETIRSHNNGLPATPSGGSLVGTTDTQTLTNKTLSGASVTSPSLLGIPVVTKSADDAAFVPSAGFQIVEIDGSAASVDITIAAPVPRSYIIFTCLDSTESTTVTLTAGDFDGTGAFGNVATFDAAEETLIVYGVSATRYVIVENIGGVAFS